MEIKEAIQVLKDHNIWRRYDGEIEESPEMTDPKKLGIAIDTVVNEFENLFISGVIKMDRQKLITSKEYWIEQLENRAYNGISIYQFAETIANTMKEAINYSQCCETLPADDLIKSLGEAKEPNEYILKTENGGWWIEHKHVGSAEPLKQWLTDKPVSG